MYSLFEIDKPKEKDKKALLTKSELKIFEKKTRLKSNADDILKSFDYIPKEGEAHSIFTSGQSNAGGFYECYRDKFSYVEELVLATWIISRDYAMMIHDDLKNKRLGGLTMMISNRMSQLPNKKATYNYIVSEYPSIKGANFGIVNSHAKTYGLIVDGNYINVEGSGNWSENPRIENYTISNNKDVYDFRKESLTKFINEKKH